MSAPFYQRSTLTTVHPIIPTGAGAVSSSDEDLDRVEAWMRKKHLKTIVARVKTSAAKSKRRGAKSALVPVGDLLDLIRVLEDTE